MARNYKPRRFANVGLLRKMDFPLLLRLLEPYRLYFEEHSEFLWSTEPDQFRFDVLAEIRVFTGFNENAVWFMIPHSFH